MPVGGVALGGARNDLPEARHHRQRGRAEAGRVGRHAPASRARTAAPRRRAARGDPAARSAAASSVGTNTMPVAYAPAGGRSMPASRRPPPGRSASGICMSRPDPSPELGSAPAAPRWRRLCSAVRACATVPCERRPRGRRPGPGHRRPARTAGRRGPGRPGSAEKGNTGGSRRLRTVVGASAGTASARGSIESSRDSAPGRHRARDDGTQRVPDVRNTVPVSRRRRRSTDEEDGEQGERPQHREQALGHRAAGRLHQVDRLGLPATARPAPTRARPDSVADALSGFAEAASAWLCAGTPDSAEAGTASAGAGAGVAIEFPAELAGQAVGEPAEQLAADVAHHAAAELGRLAGDRQVGGHRRPGSSRRRRRTAARSPARWPCPLPRVSLPRASITATPLRLVLLQEAGRTRRR